MNYSCNCYEDKIGWVTLDLVLIRGAMTTSSSDFLLILSSFGGYDDKFR